MAERLRAVALPGHAPGHTGYAFDTDEDHFLFFGDVVHVPDLQFANPAFSWGFDDDQPTARATRLRVFQDAVATGTWIAGAHLGRPGIGHVKEKHTATSRLHNERANMRPIGRAGISGKGQSISFSRDSVEMKAFKETVALLYSFRHVKAA